MTTDPLVRDIWNDKYRWKHPDGSSDEETVADTRERVVQAVYIADPSSDAREAALEAVQKGLFIPAGRENAGAGTGRAVTLINCYVMGTVQDSMPGIQWAISRGALTLQQGGGIGTDFSTIRPAGALVARTGSVASGVIQFMDQQDGMCSAIMSAGTRRGAMMGTLRDDHPDLWNERQFEVAPHPATGDPILTHPSFISAKRQKGRLMGFNVSVLVSDAFLAAVANDEMWELGFHKPRADGNHVDVQMRRFPYNEQEYDNDLKPISEDDFCAANGRPYRRQGEIHPWYVYRRVSARRIWEDIMQSTYKYAEPGVIYIDRVNDRNNLNYCEDIRCTNPCGEQPLPPEGCCCLGSVNLAFMVDKPFTPLARFDFDLLDKITRIGVRFLDNVLDESNYPLLSQSDESMQKRRIGLGVTGFADALIQLGIRYGSDESVKLARQMAKTLKVSSYWASAELAKQRGPFPLFDSAEFCRSYNVTRDLPAMLVEQIRSTGIRNGVLNTIAPNGTISIYTGNLASGHEPVFSFQPTQRKVRQPDGSAHEYTSIPYSANLYRYMYPGVELPDYFVGAMDISVEDHVRIHAAWQEYIDASISKTINCPTAMSYYDFKCVYDMAYELGCKGCTTYRFDPAAGRGSVLAESEPEKAGEQAFTVDDPKPQLDFGQVKPAPLFSEDTVNTMAVELYACYNHITTQGALEHLKFDKIAMERWVDLATHGLEKLGHLITIEIAQNLAEIMEKPAKSNVEVMPPKRVVDGRRYKLKWPQTGDNYYVTITRVDNTPFEVFITTKDVQHAEFVQALSRLLTAVLRRGGDVRFLVQELQAVHAPTGGAFIAEQHSYRNSVVAAIGGIIEEEFRTLGLLDTTQTTPEPIAESRVVPVTITRGQPGMADCCPRCGATPLVHEQGCIRCLSCDYSKC